MESLWNYHKTTIFSSNLLLGESAHSEALKIFESIVPTWNLGMTTVECKLGYGLEASTIFLCSEVWTVYDPAGLDWETSTFLENKERKLPSRKYIL